MFITIYRDRKTLSNSCQCCSLVKNCSFLLLKAMLIANHSRVWNSERTETYHAIFIDKTKANKALQENIYDCIFTMLNGSRSISFFWIVISRHDESSNWPGRLFQSPERTACVSIRYATRRDATRRDGSEELIK